MSVYDEESRMRDRMLDARRHTEPVSEALLKHKSEAEQLLTNQILSMIRIAYDEGRDHGYFDFGYGAFDTVEERWPGVKAVIDVHAIMDNVRAAIKPWEITQKRYGGYNIIFPRT